MYTYVGKLDWPSCQTMHAKAETMCLVVVCGEFSALLNGKAHVINRTYQSRVNFTCEDGYDLVGSSSAVCLANGTWNDELPRCRSKDEFICVYLLARVYVCKCVCVCTPFCLPVCLSVYLFVCLYVCMHVCMYVCICVCMCV